MRNLAGEIRFAVRMLLKHPAFTLISLTVLALGIGANTAIFSVVHAILLRPLPYEKPQQLVLLWETMPQSNVDSIPTAEAIYLEWRERNRVFSSISGFRLRTWTLSGDSEPQPVKVVTAGADLFETLGVAPRLGRGFLPQDGQPGAAPVAVISNALWMSRFAGDPAALGKAIRLDGVWHSIVGILPDGFLFPPPLDVMGNLYEFQGEVFVPVHLTRPGRPQRDLIVLGRLKEGLPIDQAQSELGPVVSQIARAVPQIYSERFGVLLRPLHSQAVERNRNGIAVLMGASALILLIACVNVANLLLARTSTRSREIAIRLALGAGRRGVFRLLLLESLLLALLGGLAGILAAHCGLESLLAISAGQIPQIGPVALNGAVLAFSLLVTLLTGILFGMAPALQATKPDLNDALKDDGTRGWSAGASPRFRAALVVAETALAVLLLIGAGLLLKSFWQIHQVDPGFEASKARIFDLQLPQQRYPDNSHIQEFHRRLQEELMSLPSIRSVGAVSGLPLSGDRNGVYLGIEGRPAATLDQRAARIVGFRVATPGYFEAMGIQVLQGRAFLAGDRSQSLPVVVIDQAAAQRFWPDGAAIGARVTYHDESSPNLDWRLIVGIVANVRQETLDQRSQIASGTVYYPLAQQAHRVMTVVARMDAAPDAAASMIREKVAQLDAELPVRLRSLTSLVEEAQSERRSLAVLLGGFAAVAMLLCVVGLYGVISFLVQRRIPEFGVRMALGAQQGDILRLVGSQTAAWVLAGIAIGLAAALALSKAMAGLLFQVSSIDPVTYLSASALFAAVAALSAYLPARRASRVEPSVALSRG